MPISDRVADLGRLARLGGQIAQDLREFGLGSEELGRAIKPDGTIVTEADRRIERMLREELPRLVPGSTVWGEEYGPSEEGPEGLWVVDPVDGTSNYSYGGPLWGVSIALVKGDVILLAAVFLPDLRELYLAELGQGAYVNGAPLEPIPPGPIRPDELVDYSDGVIRMAGPQPLPGKMRLSGSAVIAGVFVATQRIRGLIGHKERLYDIGACVLIARELGADVRYANGEPLSIEELKRPEQIGKPWIMFPRNSGFFLE